MPIDKEKALAAVFEPAEGSWNQDDVILYHLGLGAGLDKPTDAKELEYTYEKNLKALPSFGVVPVFDALGMNQLNTRLFEPPFLSVGFDRVANALHHGRKIHLNLGVNP